MPTVIDTLIVKLGLDPSAYKKGEEDAAKATTGTATKVSAAQKKTDAQRKKIETEQARRTKQLADEERKRADSTVKGFKDIALQAGALFLGFDSLKGFISLLGTLNTGEANLGRLSANLGVNTHELNTWGLAAERLGGKAEDVQTALANVSKSVTDLNVNAQVSPLFLLAQRMGLDIRNVTDKTKFLLDLGDKLRDYSAKHGRDAAYNIGAQAGIDATTFNLITADNARALLAEASRLNNITEATAKEAEATQAKIEKLKQRGAAIVRDIGHAVTAPVVNAIDGTLTASGHELEAINAAAHGDFGVAWNQLKNAFGRGIVEDRGELEEALQRSEDYFKLPKGMLSTIAELESAFQPDIISGRRKSKKGAVGLMQLMPQTFGPDVGKDTFSDIDTAAKELARLAKHYGGDYVLAAEAYNWGQGNLDHYLKGDVDPKTGRKYVLPQETINYAKRVAASPDIARTHTAAGATTGGNTTTVTVGEVTVNTAATDANGTAAGLAGAIKRQTYTAQANTGQVQ